MPGNTTARLRSRSQTNLSRSIHARTNGFSEARPSKIICRTIRQALALTTMFQNGLSFSSGEVSFDDDLEIDGARAVTDFCEAAWRCAQDLSEGLPAQIHDLHVISPKDDENDGGAR